MKSKLLSLIAVVLLSACASSAMKQSMTLSVVDLPERSNPALKGSVSIRNVSGGQETNPLWISRVDNNGLRGALDSALAATGYLASDPSKAKYQLDVTLQQLKQPLFGSTFDVTSTVLYRLSNGSEQKDITVTATGTATGSDSFLGYERMRIANERSMKENIKSFVDRLGNEVAN